MQEQTLAAFNAGENLIGISNLNLLDTGDFIEATGLVIKTKTGEVSLELTSLKLATKSIRPMPLEHESFTDKEERLRRRYVDMNVNIEVRDRMVRRSVFWQATRDFFNSKGFIEIYNNVLETTAGGADANPFVTHMDALDQDFYLRISFVGVLKEKYGIDVFESSMEDIQAKLKKEELEVERTDNRIRSLDKLWKKIRKTIAGPAYLIDVPVFMQPLAKVNQNDSRLTEQFNLVFGGSEMCKAFSELNDPIDQLNRFVEQQQMRDAGDDEAQMLDIDFVEALEYGMPPACGLGYSERIFWSLEGVSAREGIPFPQLKSEIDETTKSIYANIKF